MKKNKNKNTKEVMLKVKFKLESSESRSERPSSNGSKKQVPHQTEIKGSKQFGNPKAAVNGDAQQLF